MTSPLVQFINVIRNAKRFADNRPTKPPPPPPPPREVQLSILRLSVRLSASCGSARRQRHPPKPTHNKKKQKPPTHLTASDSVTRKGNRTGRGRGAAGYDKRAMTEQKGGRLNRKYGEVFCSVHTCHTTVEAQRLATQLVMAGKNTRTAARTHTPTKPGYFMCGGGAFVSDSPSELTPPPPKQTEHHKNCDDLLCTIDNVAHLINQPHRSHLWRGEVFHRGQRDSR